MLVNFFLQCSVTFFMWILCVSPDTAAVFVFIFHVSNMLSLSLFTGSLRISSFTKTKTPQSIALRKTGRNTR